LGGLQVALTTAIVLQTLSERGLLTTAGGQSAFSVLLFQDIAVLPMLAVMPLLATTGGAGEAAHAADATRWLVGLPPWAQTLVVLGAVAGVLLAGWTVVRPALRLVPSARMREVFTAAALFLVVGVALPMDRVGLSPTLGTFLAGVVLANSEYRHQLESDIEPFKGLLLGLFFIAVGASIDFCLVGGKPGLIVGITAGILILKFSILFGPGAGRGMGRRDPPCRVRRRVAGRPAGSVHGSGSHASCSP